jgi:hypothetical protein
MEIPIRILTAEVDEGDGVIMTFSDGTTAAYVVEELLELRPHREKTLKTPRSPAISHVTPRVSKSSRSDSNTR